jgi:hypothetical protein
VIKRLEMGGDSDIVFVDADCLINRELSSAFTGFDLGLTRRADPISPINNGAMYVARHGIDRARDFFCKALTLCGGHWGADQEAISQAAAPVPDVECRVERDGMLIEFLSMRQYGAVPKVPGEKHKNFPFVIHFKGATKDWAEAYARRFIFH